MYKKALLQVLFILLFIVESLSQSAVCAYKYRKRIAFDPAQVSGATDLIDFPAMINITADNDLRVLASSGHVENANGYDIIFVADDGITLLNFQLEKYTSTTGELIAWVKIPTLSTTLRTYIYMYYGNAAIITDQSSTNTWDADYRGVYHLGANYNDNTSTGNNGTNSGLTLGAARIGNGGIYNANTDYVTIGVTGWSATTATYECWVRATGAWPATEAYFLGQTTLPAYNNRVQIYSVNGRLRVGLGNSHAIGGDLFTLATNTWYFIAVTYNSGSFTVYVNGASVYTGAYAALTTLGSANIGNDGNTATRNEAMTSGIIDEMKISDNVRTADWILTEYNNQNSPATFYSISAEPKVWTGGVNTNYNTAANWLNNSAPTSGDDVIINNGTNQPTLQVNEQVAGLFVRSGATLSLSNRTLSVRFDITNCGTITGNTGTVTCNSTAAFIQNQYFSGSGNFNLYRLTINNTFGTSPSLILNKDVSVTNSFTLTSGIVYTTLTNILNLTSTASSTSGLATSFVSGPMTKAGTTAFVFPVGKGTSWRRIGIGAPSSSTTFRAEYFNTAFVNTTSVTAPIVDVSTMEYWTLDQAVGTGNAIVTLHWENATASGINDCLDLTIAHWTGASWDEKAGTATGTCSGAGTGFVASNIAVTTFSPFTFGSKTNGVNPLPIELTRFTANVCNQEVCLDWTTLSETNNDYFTIEKTKDGASFEAVGTKDGAGNSTALINYSLVDQSPFEGVSYYRLKQTDFDGNYTYSALEQVEFTPENDFAFEVFPNPSDGTDINVMLSSAAGEEILVVVYDARGRESYSKIIITQDTGENVYAIDPSSKLSSGIYFISATSKDAIYNKKLVVK